MPVFRKNGFKFFFYANEGDPREPVHVHVEKNDIGANFWVKPVVILAYNDGSMLGRSGNSPPWSRRTPDGLKGRGMGFFGQGDLGPL